MYGTERGNTHSYMRAEVKLYEIITDCRTVRYNLRQDPWWVLENAYIFMDAISLLKPISIVQLEKKPTLFANWNTEKFWFNSSYSYTWLMGWRSFWKFSHSDSLMITISLHSSKCECDWSIIDHIFALSLSLLWRLFTVLFCLRKKLRFP